MGKTNRQKNKRQKPDWPRTKRHDGLIDLHILPPVAAINGARIRALTGNDHIPKDAQISLRAFRAEAGERKFHVGFAIGDGERFSAIGIAVIDRLMMEAQGATLHVVPVIHEDIAWDTVLSHLRSFTGEVLLFALPDSDIYDAGTAEISYSNQIRQFDAKGTLLRRLCAEDRHKIRLQKAAVLNRPPPPELYSAIGVAQQELPWVFRFVTPAGKIVRTAAWNGRRDYAHELPKDILRWVGGDRIAIVQVDSPVGVDLRSTLKLTHTLSAEYDGVIHWARDTETYQSILKSLIRMDLETVSSPELPEEWNPDVTILAANGA